MRVGTKSVLFSAHCFFIHPWFVARAWRRLYGFPWDPRRWVAFFTHDLGYWGKLDMDGPDGEQHPWWGAGLLSRWFDTKTALPTWRARTLGWLLDKFFGASPYAPNWYCFSLYHSRFLAKSYGMPFTRLCVADKLAIVLTPWWLYGPLARASGELAEYLSRASQREGSKYSTMNLGADEPREWYRNMQAYVGEWVREHQDLRPDTWTPEAASGS